MRHVLFTLSLLLLPLFTGAQRTARQVKTDSLEQVLPTLADTFRLKTLMELAQLTTYSDPSHHYLNQLEEEAKKQENAYYQAFVWAKRVEFLYSDFQSDSIFRVGQQAEEFARQHQVYHYLTLIQQTVAKRYIDQKSYALGLAKVQQMHREALDRNDYMGLARASSLISRAYGEMGMWEEKETYLNESFQWLDRAGNPYSTLYTDNYLEMISFCLNTKEYAKSLLYTDSLERKVEEISRRRQDLDFSHERYLIEYLRGSVYIHRGEYDRSLEHIRRAESLLNEAWPEFYRQQVNELYASYYYGMGDFRQAYDYNEQTLRFYLDNQLERVAVERYEKKGDILSRLGDYEEAVAVYRLYIERNDELNRTEFKYQINEMRTLYDLEKVEMAAAQDRLRLLSARRLMFALLGCLFLLGCIVVLVALNRRRLARKNRLLFRQLEERDRLLQQSVLLRSKERQTEDTSLSETEPAGGKLFDRLEQLIRETQLYTRQDVTRKSVAAELFTNENYLHAAIKENMDMSFAEYINYLRLEHGRKLLLHSPEDYSIEEVVTESGFGSRVTFYRLFRERYGMSPSEFRRIAREEKSIT